MQFVFISGFQSVCTMSIILSKLIISYVDDDK